MESDLTAIEVQVLQRVAAGASDKQIALDLILYEGAVRAYVRSIIKKLSVKTREEIAAVHSRGLPSQEPSLATDGERGGGGGPMAVRGLVQRLIDLVWEREQLGFQSAETVVMGYLRDAVTVGIDHRRRVRDLDRRLAELER